MTDLIPFTCPHCGAEFVVQRNELNCRIIRHFVFKDFQQLNPHAPREECERVVRENLGYGCAKPVELVQESCQWIARASDYV